MSGDLTIDELRALAGALPVDEFRRQVGPFVLVRQIFDGDGPLADVPGRVTMKLDTAEIMAKAMLVALDESQALVAILAPSSPESELKVGRDASCGFSVHDRSVSKHHAVLRWNEQTQRGEVRDLGSTNGTFVNAARLGEEPALLADGDVISFGDLSYTYQLTETMHANVARMRGRRAAATTSAGAGSSGDAALRTNGGAKPRAIGAVPLRRAPFRMVPLREPAPPPAQAPAQGEDAELDTYPPPMPPKQS